MHHRLLGAMILTIFLLVILSGCSRGSKASGHSRVQETEVIRISKISYLRNVSKACIPQLKGMENKEIQGLINTNLQLTILSFANPGENSSLHGDVEVSFYSSNLLGFHFQGNSFTPGAARPNKIDKGIHINLKTGKVYKIEDLFKQDVNFEKHIQDLCLNNDKNYRIYIDTLWDGWTNKTFQESWVEKERSFLLLENSIRVYSIPSYAQGPISGYNIPYSKLMDVIDTNGDLWKTIQSDRSRIWEVLIEEDQTKEK